MRPRFAHAPWSHESVSTKDIQSSMGNFRGNERMGLRGVSEARTHRLLSLTPPSRLLHHRQRLIHAHPIVHHGHESAGDGLGIRVLDDVASINNAMGALG